jgi:drug/metabolite transporter (DMT)-like permease
VLLGLSAAGGAAVAFGVAAVLQAVAARREPTVHGVDPLLLLRLLRYPAFLCALALNLGGFLLHVAALRTLPLFLAQAVIASSVAVTAVLGARVLGARLAWREQAAVAGVCLGLALLTATAAEAGTTQAQAGVGRALLAGVVLLAAAGVLTARVQGPVGASLMGLVAGLGFAVVAVAGRVLPGLEPATLVRAPATYGLLLAGPLAFLLYATALQRAAVLTATSSMVLASTAAPALFGVLALGDRVREGAAPLVLLGLALAVAGSAALARHDPHALAAELLRSERPAPPG